MLNGGSETTQLSKRMLFDGKITLTGTADLTVAQIQDGVNLEYMKRNDKCTLEEVTKNEVNHGFFLTRVCTCDSMIRQAARERSV